MYQTFRVDNDLPFMIHFFFLIKGLAIIKLKILFCPNSGPTLLFPSSEAFVTMNLIYFGLVHAFYIFTSYTFILK